MTDRRQDPLQLALINETIQAAGRLFPQAQIHLLEEPVQAGTLTVAVDNPKITLQDAQMIRDFSELTAGADMVFINPKGDLIRLELVFRNGIRPAPQP